MSGPESRVQALEMDWKVGAASFRRRLERVGEGASFRN